jgi:hypothetical protein
MWRPRSRVRAFPDDQGDIFGFGEFTTVATILLSDQGYTGGDNM